MATYETEGMFTVTVGSDVLNMRKLKKFVRAELNRKFPNAEIDWDRFGVFEVSIDIPYRLKERIDDE